LLAEFSLVTYLVTHVLDCFANFPSGLAEAFFYLAACVVGSTFGLEFVIINNSADSLFSLAFGLIQFSFQFVPIR